MKAKSAPWWQNFQIIAYVVGGLGALLTVAVVTAKYAELPTKVEAAEQKNASQDEAINKLTVINETWQQIYQQQQQQQVPNRSMVEVWRDDDGVQWCCESQCGETMNWWRCER